jgi:hypothetical protein
LAWDSVAESHPSVTQHRAQMPPTTALAGPA